MPYIDQVEPIEILLLKYAEPETQLLKSEEVLATLSTSISLEPPSTETVIDIKTLIRDLELEETFETLLLECYGDSEDWAGGVSSKVMQWTKSTEARRLTLVDKARVKALSRTITRWFLAFYASEISFLQT